MEIPITFVLFLGLLPLAWAAHPVYVRPEGHSVLGLSEFISAITLCLAPLAAHIAFGLDQPIHLTGDTPSIVHRLAHYSPISIVWRYYAILDRRFRAKSWDPADLAACNAAFWNGKTWDGSEAIMMKSRQWAIMLPPKSHVQLFSGSTLATCITTLQGLQAMYDIVGHGYKKTHAGVPPGLPGLFYPIAIMGLLRLPCALWLTHYFAYDFHQSKHVGKGPTRNGHTDSSVSETDKTSAVIATEPATSEQPAEEESRMLPISSPIGIAYRIWWISSLVVTTVFAFRYIFGGILWGKCTTFSLGVLMSRSMYAMLILGTVCIHTIYVLKDRTSSSIIPCINSKWYQTYTVCLFLHFFIVFTITATQTRKTPCGTYTTYPVKYDHFLCHEERQSLLNMLAQPLLNGVCDNITDRT
jgi:hypothetical protein